MVMHSPTSFCPLLPNYCKTVRYLTQEIIHGLLHFWETAWCTSCCEFFRWNQKTKCCLLSTSTVNINLSFFPCSDVLWPQGNRIAQIAVQQMWQIHYIVLYSHVIHQDDQSLSAPLIHYYRFTGLQYDSETTSLCRFLDANILL